MNWFHHILHAPCENARAQVDTLLADRQLAVHFQAVIDLASGEVLGYEALTRCPPDSPFGVR